MATFIAIIAFGGSLLVGGFTVGQQNPDAENVLKANPQIVEVKKYTVDERF